MQYIQYAIYTICKMQNTLGKNMPNKICQTQFSTPRLAQGCNLLSDTICGSRSELQMLDEEGDDDEVYDNMYDPDPDEEAILHYEAPTEKEDDEEEVFGERRTEERQKDGNSPTRDILKYRMRERGDLRSLKKATMRGGLDVGDGLETHSDYGQPAFFEEEEDPGERNQVVDQAERPIVDVVRQNLIVQTYSHFKISGETVPHDQLDIVSHAEAGRGQVDPKREEKPRHDDEVEGDDEDLVGQGDNDLVEGGQPGAERWKRHTRLPSRTGVASRGGGHEHKEGEEHHL